MKTGQCVVRTRTASCQVSGRVYCPFCCRGGGGCGGCCPGHCMPCPIIWPPPLPHHQHTHDTTATGHQHKTSVTYYYFYCDDVKCRLLVSFNWPINLEMISHWVERSPKEPLKLWIIWRYINSNSIIIMKLDCQSRFFTGRVKSLNRKLHQYHEMTHFCVCLGKMSDFLNLGLHHMPLEFFYLLWDCWLGSRNSMRPVK